MGTGIPTGYSLFGVSDQDYGMIVCVRVLDWILNQSKRYTHGILILNCFAGVARVCLDWLGDWRYDQMRILHEWKISSPLTSPFPTSELKLKQLLCSP